MRVSRTHRSRDRTGRTRDQAEVRADPDPDRGSSILRNGKLNDKIRVDADTPLGTVRRVQGHGWMKRRRR